MENPGKLLHATPTWTVEYIMREGLKPTDPTDNWVNLSTDDESELVAFFGLLNGCIDDEDESACDTITLLEVDTTGLPLQWPGYDGPNHFLSLEVIPPERIRIVSVCTLEQVQQWFKGEPMKAMSTAEAKEREDRINKNYAAFDKRTTI